MQKSILTPADASNLLLAAYKFSENSNAEAYLEKIEKLVVEKLFQSAEIDRLLKLHSEKL